MKHIIIVFKVVLIITTLLLRFSIAKAQNVKISEPLSMIKSIESDDPLRYYFGSDPGIPGGDINGDGVMEYIIQNQFYPDKNTLEIGDWIENTLIYNFDENGNKTYYSIRSGLLFEPAGDLNGDGRDELVAIVDSTLYIYTFGPGDFDISGDLTQLYEIHTSVTLNQFVPTHDFDDDGFNDLLIGSYDYTTGSSFQILFGGETGESFEFKVVDILPDLGDVEIQTNAGDIVGDESSDVILLATTPWPHELMAAAYSVDSLRNISFVGTSDFGSSNVGATTLRFFVENVDGEFKDDLLYSEDRYISGKGFTQIFFNEPTPYIALSVVDTTASKTSIALNGQMPDWVEKQGAIGLGINHVLRGDIGTDNNTSIGLWQKGSLSIINGKDISIENPLPEPVVVETPNENDIILQTKYAPNRRNRFGLGNDTALGWGNPSGHVSGSAIIRASKIFGIQAIFSFVRISYFESEIQETKVVKPDGDNILIDLGLVGQWFPTQYLSLFAQVGLKLDFIGAEEFSSPTDSEPTGSFGANGAQGVTFGKGVDFFGVQSESWWKRVATPDTATLLQSIRVTDFQEFGEDDTPRVWTNNIGDINNDGFDDLLMSSGNSYSNGSPVNKAWLFYGGESYSSMPDYTFDFGQDSSIANTYSIFITTKMEPLSDVNGDGIDDFALSVNAFDNTGAVYVYYGDEQFFSAEVQQTEFRYPDLILTPEVIEGQTITGYGKDISSGDFDGDGELDIAIIHSGYGTPSPAIINIFTNDGDENPDIFLTTTRVPLGKEGSANVSSTYNGTITFLPKEDGKTHQDLLFTPGGLSGYPNAIIFEGGAEADSLPDIILPNPNKYTGFGSINSVKPGVGDLNDDGFYDIMMLSQSDNEDAFVSSRVYMFSPNSGIEATNIENESFNPFEYRLSQNYPNPFNPSTNIEFRLGNTSMVTLKVYDVLGREVANLVNNQQYQSGSYTVSFDASKLASGMYIYRLEAGGFSQTRKMLLIK
tara:strand:- start:13609 stop:16575 length:2967 start_codon:yes stop_codon:yes gene_type:complete